MGEDLSQGVKVAVILILLASVIAIVFSILSIMKNITGQSTQDMQSTLSSVSKQKYDDYDQRTVTGAQIVAACKLFNKQPISLVVYTNRDDTPRTYGLTGVATTMEATSTDTAASKLMSTIADVTYDSTAKKVTVANGYVTATLPGGDFVYQNDRSSMNTNTLGGYISNTSQFKSWLIKTSAGDIIGILFDEL